MTKLNPLVKKSTQTFSNFFRTKHKPSPRTGPQDLLVTHYDCEENEQKTLHKFAINQVTQCESEPQAIETTNLVATLYSKARATTLTGYKFTATFSEKKVHCSHVSNGNKNRLDHESIYQKNIERLLHLSPEKCKKEPLRFNLTKNKVSNRRIVNFQVFADSVHQAELERYQGHIKIDEKYNGAHGRLIYDIHDKHWIPHIGINNPTNCKADKKNRGYQKIMLLDWKVQLEKIQITLDLKDNTIIHHGIRLTRKNYQGYCDPTTRTKATIVWFTKDTCTIFQVAKIHARMIKFHEYYFIESIPFDTDNPSQIRNRKIKFRNFHNIENELTRFEIYHETELACKYQNPLHKTQLSEILVEYDEGFDMTTGKLKKYSSCNTSTSQRRNIMHPSKSS